MVNSYFPHVRTMYWVFQRKHTLFSVRSELNSIRVCSVRTIVFTVAVLWLRRLVAGLSPRRPGFDLESVGVIKWNWDSFSPSTSVSPVSIIPPVLHTHLNLRCSYQKDKLANAGNFPKSSALLEIGELWTEKQCHFFCLKSWSVTQLLDLASRCAPPRPLSVSRPVPSQGLIPLHSSGSTSLPCPSTAPCWELCHRPFALWFGHERQEGLDTMTDSHWHS